MNSHRLLRCSAVRALLAITVAIALGLGGPSLAVAAPGASCPGGDTWTQFHNSASMTGWNCAERDISRKNVGALVANWSAGGTAWTGSPIVLGSRIFFVSDTVTDSVDHFSLESVRRSDGASIWSAPLTGGPIIPPGALAYADGRILVVAHGRLLAYRADTGLLGWSVPVGQSRGPTVSDHTAYLGSSDRKVYAVSTTSGALRWTRTLPAEISSELAVSEGRVFVAAAGEMFALAITSGNILWHRTIGEVYGGGAAVSGKTVYVAANVPSEGSGAVLFALSTSTGAPRWSAPAGDDVHSVPAVDDRTVYIGSIGSEVRAYDAPSGAVRWVQTFGGQEIWSSIASANGVVYLSTDVDTAYALNAQNGAVLWTVSQSTEVTYAGQASPAVAGGRVYFPFGNSGLISYAPKRN